MQKDLEQITDTSQGLSVHVVISHIKTVTDQSIMRNRKKVY